jgi:putative flippase GtrA
MRELEWVRPARFLFVGGFCLLAVQLPLLWILRRAGLTPVVANSVAFGVSAVINFILSSKVTWRDRMSSGRLWRFLANAVVALGVNAVAFQLLYLMGLHTALASVGAVVIGSSVTYLVNDRLVFLPTTATSDLVARDLAENLPGAGPVDISHGPEPLKGSSLTFFLPAYREAANLPTVVTRTHEYLSTLELSRLSLVIVDDGSPDATGDVADNLAREVPDVRVVHHEVNKGYGGALMSGIRSAIEDGHEYWGFSDADGQFAAESVGTLLRLSAETGADMVVGRRVGRETADSSFRYYLGRLWHMAGRITLGSQLLAVDDVDCGLKVGRTRAIAEIAENLHGQGAAISPELVARSALAGHRVVQCDIPHHPRLAGESTGSDLRVALRSAWHLVRLGFLLRLQYRGLWRSETPPRLADP